MPHTPTTRAHPAPRACRAASEAAQHALVEARAAHADALAPFEGFDLTLLDAPTRTHLTALHRQTEACAWALVMCWQPRIAALVHRFTSRHAYLPLVAEDLQQDALTWGHQIALKWSPERGMSWPGFLKLCLTRRLADLRAQLATEHRHRDPTPLSLTGSASGDDVPSHPEPADPRPTAERLLSELALGTYLHTRPGDALRRLLTDLDLTLPQRGELITACGLAPRLRSLLDIAPLSPLQRTVLARRLGAGGAPRPVRIVAASLNLTPARVKLLQRIALRRLQEALIERPGLADLDQPIIGQQEALLCPRCAPDSHTPPPRSRRHRGSSPAAVLEVAPATQLNLLSWLLCSVPVAVA